MKNRKEPLTFPEILDLLETHRSAENVAGLVRFGITAGNLYGISVPQLRRWARQIGRDHALAQRLWDTGIHDARILATLIDRPDEVTEEQMESWVRDFDSWGLCDQACCNLFDKTPFARAKILQWSERPEEYVKRAAFTLIAALAVHDKKSPDSVFESFLPLILRESTDERNFVRKAVNWALRQIGKRNGTLHPEAVRVAKELKESDNKTARWIGSDAWRELTGDAVVGKFKNG